MAKLLLGFSPPLAWAILAQSTVCAVAPTNSWAAPEPVIQSGTEAPFNNINLLTNKGAYWYERYRFDLATEAFNRVLLIDPLNPSALRWQGLIELARGDADAANIWLKKLNSVHGQQHPQSIELKQVIELNTTKRQKFAELRYLASARPPVDLATQLSNLLEQAPQGEAAAQIYRVMAKTSDGRVLARQRLHALAQQNPQDRRYTTLIKDLGLLAPEPAIVTVALPQTQKKPAQTLGYRPNKATTSRQQPARTQTASANATSEASSVTEAVIAPPNVPNISNFDQGKAWADQAQAALNDKEYTQAIELLQQAVNINPDYAWFRFDLANAWMDSGSEGAAPAAQDVMEQGLSVLNNGEMRFASALLATRQDRTQDALNLLAQTPRAEWSDSMINLERRINLNQHLSALNTLEQKEAFNNMGKLLQATPEFNDEPRVKAYQDQLDQKKQIRVHAAYANATIDGTPGVSHVDMREIPLQLDIPLDYENKLFLRMDRLQVRAGQVDLANTTNFAQLGTTTATDPAIQPSRLNQNYQGHLIGVGVETPKLRLDLGTTVGNFAVNDWVGGAQWKKTIGQSTLRLELSRRMIVGSALSTTGAIDPLTGQAWGAAKRNGVSGLLYSPLTPTLDFIGIAKANRITGKHLPSNNEYSLQGILSKTIYQNPVHRVELGGSLFLWSFSKNLRYYTYGQGGYYSPQAFASFSLPITWSGKVNTWAWRVQAKIGASESREDPAALYPLDPQLATAANTLGNSVENEGGPGGGTSRGLRVQLEHQVFSDLVLGGLLDIDRAEGYNPNRLQMYLRYTFGPNIEWNQPPEAVAPYSRF